MKLKDKRILVVGLGTTGEALCEFLLRAGARVTVSERKQAEELGGAAEKWIRKGITVEAGEHRMDSFLEAEMIITSPGVPHIEPFLRAGEKGIPILSEVELASHFLRGRIVGITGSNGKSTTTTLTHKILKEAGLKSFLAGNIGTPLISFTENSRDDHIYVTELSSFQLDLIRNFRAEKAVFLNVSPDHLDWHKSFEHYLQAKKNLFANQIETDTAILNRDDPLVWEVKQDTRARIASFSRTQKAPGGCGIESARLVFYGEKPEEFMKLSEIPLLGSHNQENVMASALVGHAYGVPADEIRKSVMAFSGLPHRLERVAKVDDVEFFNDSKATNVDAALKSIESFDRPIILILGGRDKDSDFSRLRDAASEKAKAAVILGEAKEKIKTALKGALPILEAAGLREAVRKAFGAADPGSVVLLAPACTSWDMFRNFEERGDLFKEEVRIIKEIQER